MPAKLISIKQAAKELGVSSQTLRNWEMEGRLVPLRTPGGHRRYSSDQLEAFRHHEYQHSDQAGIFPQPPEAQPIYPNISLLEVENALHPKQRKGLKSFISFTLAVALFFTASKFEAHSQIQNKSEGKVLQAATSLLNPTFSINVPTFFRGEGVTVGTGTPEFIDLIAGNQYISGDLEVTGVIYGDGSELTGVIASSLGGLTATNFLRSDADDTFTGDTLTIEGTLSVPTITSTADLLINPAGGGASVGTGSVDTIDLAGGDLYVTADLEVDGIIYGNGSGLTSLPVGDATTLDSIDSTGFLRSDTSDAFTSGTLTVNSGTTLAVAGTLALTGAVTSSSTMTLADAAFLDLSAILHDDTALQGLRLPQNTALTAPTSGEGFLAYDSDDNSLQLYNGTTWSSVGGVSGSATAGQITFWDTGSSIAGDTGLTYASSTDILSIGTGGKINPATDLGADLGTASLRYNNIYAANLTIDSGFNSSGQLLVTYDPTDTTFAQSSIRVNVTSPSANEQMLGIGQGGEERAAIDAEGDLSIGFDGAAGSSVTASADPFNVYGHSTTRVFGITTAGNIDTSNQTIDWTLNAAVDGLNIDSNTLSIDASNNRVGIGNAAPTTALDVTGTVTATDFECTTCVDTGDLNTTTGVQTAALTSGSNVTITMNDYSFAPNIGWSAGNNRADVFGTSAVADTVGRLSLTNNSTDGTYTVRWRYVTASRDQEIFAWFDIETGTLQSAWVSEIEKPDILPVETDHPSTWIPVQATIYDKELTTLGKLPDIDNILKNHTFTLLAKASEIADTHPLKAQKIAERDECLSRNNNNESKCFQFITHPDIYYGKLEPSEEATQKWATLESQMRTKAENNQEIYGSDLAEYYNGQEEVEPGDIVSIDTNSSNFLVHSSRPYDSTLVGIVSTAPGQVLGDESVGEIKLSLTGRVPVKIASSSAAIRPGDFITSSNEPGKGVKATGPGYTIGKALESWDPNNPKEKILVFINLGYYAGELSTDGFIQEKELTTDQVSISSDLWEQTYNQPVNAFLEQNSTNSAELDLEIATASGAPRVSLTTTLMQLFERLGALEDLLANGLASFKQAVTFLADVTFGGRVVYSDKDVAGFATIPSSQSRVRVEFERAYQQTPIVNITLRSQIKLDYYRVTDDSPTGFTIEISPFQAQDVVFSWSAIAVTNISNIKPAAAPANPTPTQTSNSPAPSPSPTPTDNLDTSEASPSAIPVPTLSPSPTASDSAAPTPTPTEVPIEPAPAASESASQ